MKKVTVLLFLLVFTLVGCQNKQLSSPQNIAYNNEGYLIWDEVENAEEYYIKIEDNEYRSEVAVFDITNIITEKGFYDVEIIAVGEGYDNSDSIVYSFNADYNLDATIDFSIQGDYLMWEDIFLVKDYLVTYGQEIERADNNIFDLSDLSLGDHTITVQAVFPDGSKTAIFTFDYTKE